jgi:hypothetical protein
MTHTAKRFTPFFSIICLLLSGCTAVPPKPACDGYVNQQSSPPPWLGGKNEVSKTHYRGVGSAISQPSFYQQRALALLRAKAELTTSIATQIKTEWRSHQQQQNDDFVDRHWGRADYFSHGVSEELLENTVIEDQWMDYSQCRLWLRVSLSKAQWKTTRLRQQIEYGLQQSAPEANTMGKRKYFLDLTEKSLAVPTILEPAVHHQLFSQFKVRREQWQDDEHYQQAQQQTAQAENKQYPLPQRLVSARVGLDQLSQIKQPGRYPQWLVWQNRLTQQVKDLTARLTTNQMVWAVLSDTTDPGGHAELRQGLQSLGYVVLPGYCAIEHCLKRARFLGSRRLMALVPTYNSSPGNMGGVIYGLSLSMSAYRVADGENIANKLLKQRHIAFNYPTKARESVVKKLLKQLDLKDF